YAGFEQTYQKMGIDFDKIYYESQTYLLGKSIVLKGLEDGYLCRHEDGSVWADLREEGLDEKLLLRSDGTSVYMTQDLGTAQQRQKDYNAEKLIYVVGNEQNYHFDVLKRVLNRLGYSWSAGIAHLSYGMVELPEGKMKSREGTVVDADDLIQSMTDTAQRTTEELGKAQSLGTPEQALQLYHTIAMGALKYFILKVDPSKNMLFNPKESIDFNGNTGPFIQYTYARICSLLRKAELSSQGNGSGEIFAIPQNCTLSEKDIDLVKLCLDYPSIVQQAGEALSPAIIANYIFELAKAFNSFYQDTPILREEDLDVRSFRLALSQFTAQILASGLRLLGIGAPEKM
ncbi:MAG: arginine--tRNA ligase, partial [Bacteroidales bacterium]